MRLVAASSSIDIRIKPTVYVMNPVFEIERAGKELRSVSLNGRSLPAEDYAWDGETLWVKASIGSSGAALDLKFD